MSVRSIVIRLVFLEFLDLSHDVLECVVEPLVEGDGAVGVGVHLGEVLLALGQAGLGEKINIASNIRVVIENR